MRDRKDFFNPCGHHSRYRWGSGRVYAGEFALCVETDASTVGSGIRNQIDRHRQAFLDRFSAALAPDEHAAMAVDGAGWHVAHALRIPDNVTLVLLPPYSPELNPVERVWLFLRERHLSHRLLAGYDAIVNALCTAWNALTPDRLLALTRYPYLNQVKF